MTMKLILKLCGRASDRDVNSEWLLSFGLPLDGHMNKSRAQGRTHPSLLLHKVLSNLEMLLMSLFLTVTYPGAKCQYTTSPCSQLLINSFSWGAWKDTGGKWPRLQLAASMKILAMHFLLIHESNVSYCFALFVCFTLTWWWCLPQRLENLFLLTKFM
jgi:hypothetical protein